MRATPSSLRSIVIEDHQAQAGVSRYSIVSERDVAEGLERLGAFLESGGQR